MELKLKIPINFNIEIWKEKKDSFYSLIFKSRKDILGVISFYNNFYNYQGIWFDNSNTFYDERMKKCEEFEILFNKGFKENLLKLLNILRKRKNDDGFNEEYEQRLLIEIGIQSIGEIIKNIDKRGE